MSNDFTACIRTQLKILGIGKEARLLQIGNWKKSEFLRLYARYPVTWFSFGNPKFVSWRLRDPMIKDILYSHFVWKIDLWNHICFSYSETNSYTSFVKVRNNIIKYKLKKFLFFFDQSSTECLFFEDGSTKGFFWSDGQKSMNCNLL